MSARGWFGRRRRALSEQPAGLPDVSKPVTDVELIGVSQAAAQADLESGAYDEYLFLDDNLDQMPYERTVDDVLNLTRVRLFDPARRTVLPAKQKIIQIESDVQQLNQRQAHLRERIALKQFKLEEQREILDGTRTGRAELAWPGTPPQQTSLPNAVMRLIAPYLVFVIVGAVDVGIIFKSFQIIFPHTVEAILFTLPAVGVQIVFPHLIGDRINLLARGHKHRWLLILELVVMFAVWLTFVYTLAQIRMNYVLENLPNLDDAMFIAINAGFVCMILGLGLWLLLVAARHNPHESAYARLNYAIGRLQYRADALQRKATAAEAALPALRVSLQVAEESFRDQIEATKVEMAEAAKSVYRRALINMSGNVDFTAAYLGVAHPHAQQTRAERKQRRAEARAKRDADYEARVVLTEQSPGEGALGSPPQPPPDRFTDATDADGMD